jgi:hypothetical protein
MIEDFDTSSANFIEAKKIKFDNEHMRFMINYSNNYDKFLLFLEKLKKN